MAFCMYCGKQLEDGKTCDCPESVAEKKGGVSTGVNDINNATLPKVEGNANQMNNQSQQGINPTYNKGNEQFEQMKQKSGAFLKDALEAWISILKAPVTAGKQIIELNKYQTGIGLIVFQALLTGIFGILLCSTVNDVLSIGSYLGTSDISINLFSAFLLTVIGSLLMSAARVGLLLGGAKLFKGTENWHNLVCICGVRAVGVSIVQLVSIVVYFINPAYGILFFVFSSVIGLIFSLPRILEYTGVSEDKGIYMVIGVIILLFIVLYILYKIGLPMYVPKELKKNLDGISDILRYFR